MTEQPDQTGTPIDIDEAAAAARRTLSPEVGMADAATPQQPPVRILGLDLEAASRDDLQPLGSLPGPGNYDLYVVPEVAEDQPIAAGSESKQSSVAVGASDQLHGEHLDADADHINATHWRQQLGTTLGFLTKRAMKDGEVKKMRLKYRENNQNVEHGIIIIEDPDKPGHKKVLIGAVALGLLAAGGYKLFQNRASGGLGFHFTLPDLPKHKKD